MCFAAAEIRKSGAAPEPTLVSYSDVFIWPQILQLSGVQSVLLYVHVNFYFPLRLHRKNLGENKLYLLCGGHVEIRPWGVF